MSRTAESNATKEFDLRVSLRLAGGRPDLDKHQTLGRYGSKETVILALPAWLYAHVSRLMEGGGFRNAAESVIHVLNMGPVGGGLGGEGAAYSDEELMLIRSLLENGC